MAGAPPTIPEDIMNVLSEEHRTLLQTLLTAHTATVIQIPTVKVKQINTNVKIPTYHPLKKTANT